MSGVGTFSVGPVSFDGVTTPGYTVLPKSKITRQMQNPKLITRQNPYATADLQIANIENGILEWHVPIRIRGVDPDNPDDLAARVAALNRVLMAPSGTYVITDKLSYGSAPVTIPLYTSPAIRSSRDPEGTEQRRYTEEDLVLYSRAYADGPVQALEPVAVAGVGLVPLGQLQGDVPAALSILAAPAWGAGNLARFIAAVLPADALLGAYLLSGLDASGSGWDTAYGVGYTYESAARKVTKSGWQLLNFGARPSGRFRVVCRTRSTGTGYLGIVEGDSGVYTQLAIQKDVWHLVDLGEFASGGYASLKLAGKSSKGTLYVDYVALLPVDSIVSYSDPTPSGRNLHLSSVSQYTTDTSGNVVADVAQSCIGSTIVAPLDNRKLLVLVSNAPGTYPTGIVQVSVSYTPAFIGWWH